MIPSGIAHIAPAPIVVGTIWYIWDVCRGKAEPILITWLLWSLAPLIAFFAQLKAGIGAEAWLSAAVGGCPFAVFCVGLWSENFSKPQPIDWWCGGASLLALISWRLTGSGIVGVSLSIIADSLAAAPTLRKAWRQPETESAGLFACFAVSAGTTLMTLQHWAVVNAAFATYICALYIVLFAVTQFKLGVRRQRATA